MFQLKKKKNLTAELVRAEAREFNKFLKKKKLFIYSNIFLKINTNKQTKRN